MGDLLKMALDWEQKPGVLAVTVAGGFPYADVAHAGLSVVATTDGDAGLAETIARDIARAAWERRDRFAVTSLSPNDAVQQALRVAPGPAILVDVADNIGGGSPGDGTVLLETLIRKKARRSVVTIADPEAVRIAMHRRMGEEIELVVGGKTDRLHGPPLTIKGRLERIGTGDFTYKGSYMTSRRVHSGQRRR